MEYLLARIFSLGYRQIRFVLSRSAWKRVSVSESWEEVVTVTPTERIVTGLVAKSYEASFQVRRSVAEKLDRVSKSLPDGLVLVLIEGYRPLKVQQESWDAKVAMVAQEHPEWDIQHVEHQVGLVIARPLPLANHNCGGAVDVTLAHADGTLVDMGTPYPNHAMGAEWYKKFKMFSSLITPAQSANRLLLRKAMESEGFVWYPGEWWHYCYGDRMWAVYTNRKACMYGPVGSAAYHE